MPLKSPDRIFNRCYRAKQSRPARPKNEIVQGVAREHAAAAEPDKSTHQQPRSDLPHATARDHLTTKQQQTVDVLKQMLKARGDSDAAINMAAAAAPDKFKNHRVYVGKIVESGAAPFEHDPETGTRLSQRKGPLARPGEDSLSIPHK